MLQISIDASPITANPTGVGLYASSLIASLYSLQSIENFNLNIIYQPRIKEWLKFNINQVPQQICQYQNENLRILPLLIRMTDTLVKLPLPQLINLVAKYYEPADIVHGTAYGVYPCPKSLKVMTIHDMSFIKHPEYLTKKLLRFHHHRVKNSLKWTDLIITVSQSSKQDIINYLDVDPQRIYVTPLASRYDQTWREQIKIKTPFLKTQTKYDFSKPYILFVGTIEPRKNINGIIKAFNFLKQKYQIPHQLILIGQNGWKSESIFTAIASSNWRDQIHHLAYLSDELLGLFYSQASVFIYPSYYEGFGLPVLEAMNWGIPVVTSNVSSLPEVVGNAGLTVAPDDIYHICEALWQIISDQELSNNLSRNGQDRINLFSWQRTAQETLKAYRSIL
jgi:glycosyltransferase involved in cell wall biosynthesis